MILVVTSNKQVATDLHTLISEAGYSVTDKDCDDDIPRFVLFTKPQMVVIDCDLQDSFDIIKKIRSDPFNQNVSLVMFAVAGESHREKALATGADAFVTKGQLDWNDLLQQIHRHVGAPSRQDEVEDI